MTGLGFGCDQLFSLEGRVAAITGAASGIGAATAIRFAEAGADVVLGHYPPDGHNVDDVVAAVAATGHLALAVEVDVTKAADLAAMVGAAVNRFDRLDIAVANAAIARIAAPTDISDDDWFHLCDVDLAGVWRTFRAALAPMSERGYGRLLATASTVGVLEAWPAHPHYAAAKAGVAGLVRSLAVDLGPHGITVNAVAPGIIETPQTLDSVNSLGPAGIERTALTQPVRRTGQPRDIACAFHYLASEEASFTTGQVLVVDGGRVVSSG